MNLDLIVLVVCNIANLILGSSVFLRNPRLRINQIFGFLSLSIIFWTTLNYLSDFSPIATLLFTRLTFVGGILIALTVFYLSCFLPNERLLRNLFVNKVQPFLAILVMAVSLTPWAVAGADLGANGVEISIGPLYFLYIIYFLQILLLILYNFIMQSRHARSGHERNQIRLLLTGLMLYGIFAIASNLVLPLFLNTWISSRFGPLFSLFLVSVTAYAIVKHRLFDVRLAVARSIAYLAALVTFAAIYGFTLFGLMRFVFGIELSLPLQILVSAATGFAALWFHYFRRIFDKITSKLFYRDAYDTQAFFDTLNKSLVSSPDLDTLLNSTSSVIVRFLKAQYCVIGVKDELNAEKYRILGTTKKVFSSKDIALARSVTPKIHQIVIVADELTAEHSKLQRALWDNKVELLARLTPDRKQDKEGIGYIILGQKRSGDPYNSQDIKVLEAAANELVIAIQNALRFEEIRSFNRTLQDKVSEATTKLRRTNAKLQQLDEAKDEFISMASHQLRTPLTSVKGYLSLVLEGDAGKLTANQKKLLEEAYAGAQRMVYLIGDFLNVSRMKTGKFMLEYTNSNLAQLVGDEIGLLKDTAERRRLSIVYHEPEDIPATRFDENKIRQAIMNLVDNAIYYSRPEGTVSIELYKKNEQIVFKVRDDGIGVPAKEQKDLFEKFYRASNARKVRPDGTGIGLFMIKKVILAHGGTIIFESAEGKGSTFGFTLPIKQPRVATKIVSESPQPKEK